MALSVAGSRVVDMEGIEALARRREAFAAAVEASRGLEDVLVHAMPGELGEMMGLVDAMAQAGEACRVRVAAEARARGDAGATASQVARWARQFAPSLRAGGSSALGEVVIAFTKPVNAPVREAIYRADLPVRSAAAALTEADKLRPKLVDDPDADRCVLEGLLQIAATDGPTGPARLRTHLLARYGHDSDLQHEQDHAKSQVALSQPRPTALGTFEYAMTLDPEGKEVLEAVIGPLSAPRPTDGAPDQRSSDRRRGEALITAVRRVAAAPEGAPTSAKTTLLLTMDLHDLLTGLKAAATLGGTGEGTLLGPATIRRLACDASLIPAVLGSDGQILDLGRDRRLFSTAQTRALWLRDRRCTYPHCTAPAHWCDAHHLWHWTDGGPTTLTNATLLCEHHHTLVHTNGYHATLTPTGITWDLTPGAYHHWLTRQRAETDDRKAGAGRHPPAPTREPPDGDRGP
jgi:hypothetical protein